MNQDELRIGNYVSTPDNDIHVWQFDRSDYDYYEMKDIKPIPLTEEWLIKLGFKPKENNFIGGQMWYIYEDPYTVIDLINGKFEYELCEYERSIDVIFVHQLQNIYHALTNNELIIK